MKRNEKSKIESKGDNIEYLQLFYTTQPCSVSTYIHIADILFSAVKFFGNIESVEQ